jgi:GNAT superfamily N-acetyltransferase
MPEDQVNIVEADLSRRDHQDATLRLVNAYSMDPMGDGESLSEFARQNLIQGLRQHPTTMVFLAYLGPELAGAAICFRGFSTFQARPLLNIHDIFVVPAHRGAGIARKLLAGIEARARELGFCKLTLEVLQHNDRAKGVYAAAGFIPPNYNSAGGASYFLSKSL